MSAVVIALQPYRDLLAIKNLLREVSALGARFRISGFAVEVDRGKELPEPLREGLRRYAGNGLLYTYLGGEEQDLPALDLADHLGIQNVLVETRSELRAAVRAILADIKQNGDAVGLDIETAPRAGQAERPWLHLNVDGSLPARQRVNRDRTGLDPYRSDIQTLQLYAGGRCCYILRGEALQMLLQSRWLRRLHLVIHNAGFELKFFMQHCAEYQPPPHRRSRFRYECTAQATGLLAGVGFGGEGRSLATAAKVFLGIDVPKELQTSDWGAVQLSEGQLAYAASDAVLAWRLWSPLRDQLQRKRRWGAYELQRRAIPAVADMELRGAGFDRAEHRRQVDKWASDLTTARSEYHALTGDPPPAKPDDVRVWLEKVLPPEQLETWPRTPEAQVLSIANAFLKRLHNIETARPVLEILRLEKLLQNFGPKLLDYLNPSTGRLHPSYNIAAQKSGRFSATKPNIHQLPSQRAPEFKACIVARDGYVLVVADYDQVELRGAGWISKDRRLNRFYREQRDLHVETAARIAGISPEAVTKAQRQAAKPCNYGSVYGIGPASLAIDAFASYGVEMTDEEAERAIKTFFEMFPELARWRWDNYYHCKARGYVAISCGRVVEAAWEHNGMLRFTQCCALPIQGACADAMLRAIALTYARLRQAGIRGGLIATIHDELVLEVHEDDAEEARVLLEQVMTDAFVETFPGAPSVGVVVAKIGKTWADVK
jgi:DNA polymerase-1